MATYTYVPSESVYERMEREYERAREKSRKAREQGKLVGRMVEFPVADGYAYYEVAEVKGNRVRLANLVLLDGYRNATLDAMGGWLDREYVEALLKSQDWMDDKGL